MLTAIAEERPQETPSAGPSDRWANAWAIALAVAFGTTYTVFALGLHASFQTHAFDLGIFEQAVRSYASGRLPVSTIRDPDLVLLGDHFSPIVALLVPPYLLFPSAQTLLVAQALLFGLSTLPVTRTAIRLLGTGPGITVGVCYGLSWGLQTALAVDFHEIAFAVPIMAFALEALLRDKPVRAVAIASALVLVKEDLGLTLAVLGLLIAARPATRRLGLITAAGGLAAALVAVFLVIPQFNVNGHYTYLGVGGLQPTGDTFRGELLDPGKLSLVALLLLPTLFLALRSPLVLLTVPTLVWRLAGTNWLYWEPGFHYDAILMPIVFFALIHALLVLRSAVATRLSTVVVIVSLLATCVVISAHFRLRELLTPGFGGPTALADSARALMKRIPDGASVATENEVGPHLTNRTQVYMVIKVYPIGSDQRVDWALVYRERSDLICARLGEAQDVTFDGPLVLVRHADRPAERATPQSIAAWRGELGCYDRPALRLSGGSR